MFKLMCLHVQNKKYFLLLFICQYFFIYIFIITASLGPHTYKSRSFPLSYLAPHSNHGKKMLSNRRPSRRSGRGLSEPSRRRTSPRPSGAGSSAAKSVLTSPADTPRKAKNTKCPNYNRFLFIGVVRVRSKHTPYMLWSRKKQLCRNPSGENSQAHPGLHYIFTNF
jgi:hypothetical protein